MKAMIESGEEMSFSIKDFQDENKIYQHNSKFDGGLILIDVQSLLCVVEANKDGAMYGVEFNRRFSALNSLINDSINNCEKIKIGFLLTEEEDKNNVARKPIGLGVSYSVAYDHMARCIQAVFPKYFSGDFKKSVVTYTQADTIVYFDFNKLSANFPGVTPDQTFLISSNSALIKHLKEKQGVNALKIYQAGELSENDVSDFFDRLNKMSDTLVEAYLDIDATTVNCHEVFLQNKTVLNSHLVNFMHSLQGACSFSGVRFLTARLNQQLRFRKKWTEIAAAEMNIPLALMVSFPFSAEQQQQLKHYNEKYLQDISELNKQPLSSAAIKLGLETELNIQLKDTIFTNFSAGNLKKIDYIFHCEGKAASTKRFVLFIDDNSEEVGHAKTAYATKGQGTFDFHVITVRQEGELGSVDGLKLFLSKIVDTHTKAKVAALGLWQSPSKLAEKRKRDESQSVNSPPLQKDLSRALQY